MRILEVGLITANVLTILFSFRKNSKVAWLATAGGNLFFLVLHGLLEGFRYQMVFSYGFVALFTVYALTKTYGRRSKRSTPGALKIIAAGMALVLLGFTTLLAAALPVFTLPRPSGSAAVGVQYFHLVDEQRPDPFLEPLTKKRELMVKVYYPALGDDKKPFYPYFHDSPQLIRLFAAFYNLPDFSFDHLKLIKTNSKKDLAVSDQLPRYPVILFSHGAGTTMEVQTAQSEDLASHGYIVVAVDHTYASAATVFPDRIALHHDATTNFNTVEPAEIITQIMADDMRFVIARLSEINKGSPPSMIQGRLDLDRIGVIGHSAGGAAAYNLALNDPRIKAAVNLDGVVFIAPKPGVSSAAPILMLANDKYHIQAIQRGQPLMSKLADMPAAEREMTVSIYGGEVVYQEAYNRAQQNLSGLTEVLKTSGSLYTIEGSDHMKFTDIGLFIGIRPLQELIGIGGETDSETCLKITQAVSLAFFDQHLKGEPGSPLQALLKTYPQLENVAVP